MTSLFDEYLLTQPDKPREVGIFWVTDLVKTCLRQSYLDIIDPQPKPIETLRIFEAGRAIERLWVDRVLPTHFRILGTQLPARYHGDGFCIHGRIDALVQHNDGSLVVHEVKSAKSLFYTSEPKTDHVKQLQFYLNVLNVEFGSVDYLDKTVLLQGGNRDRDAVDRCFTVQRDPAIFTATVSRARELVQFIKADTIPDASSRDWYCEYCLHHEGCIAHAKFVEVRP